MNKEFLSTIYNHLSCLNFSILPKMVKQKQTSITSNSSPNDILWNRFLQSFSNLSNCELSYYRFTYLSMKTNNLQELYLQILNDLRIIGNLNKSNRDSTLITSPTYNNSNSNSVSSYSTTTTTTTSSSNQQAPTTPVKNSSFSALTSLLKSPNQQPQSNQQQQRVGTAGNNTIQSLTQQQIDDLNSENSFFLTLVQQTCVCLQVRIEMIGIYSTLLQLLVHYDLNIENIENSLEQIPPIYKDKITHPLLIQIKTNINFEISILRNLLKAQTLVSKHIFKDSILLLFKSKIELDQWRESDSGRSSSSSSSSSSSLSSSSSSSSNDRWSSNHIHQWLSMFHNSILSKSTLYFYFPLSNVEEEIGGNLLSFKDIYQKTSPDYISIIDGFCSKNNVLFFGLIFEAKDKIYNKIGYSFNVDQEPASGLGAFPLLFYHPLDKSPMQHLPNIIGLIMQNYQSLEKPNDILYYLDSRKVKDTQKSIVYDDYITYFISRVEQNGGVFVSIIFKDIKKQKDQHINEFLKLLINSLRMNDIISILRQKDQSK